MHILFISENFFPEYNAAASRVYERACYWVKEGHEVTIITACPNYPEGKIFPGYKNKIYQVEMLHEIKVVRVKTFIGPNKGFFLRILDYISFILPAILAGIFKKYDVIIANTPTPMAAFAALVLKFLRKKPLILEVSDLWPASIVAVNAMKKNYLINILEKFELFLYRKSDAIIVLSYAFKKNMIMRKIKADKIYVILNGVELSHYYPRNRNITLAQKYGFQSNDFIIGYIGTHGMAHGLEKILECAEILINKPQLKFMFIGSGAHRERLMQVATQKKLTNVHFIPPQPKEIIPEFWSLCNLALIHLKNSNVFSEVIPSKLFEAMGMGLPILMAVPTGEATDIVVNENIGIAIPPENPDLLAQKIYLCSQNPTTLNQFAENSAQAAKKFSRELQAQKFLSVIKKIFLEEKS